MVAKSTVLAVASIQGVREQQNGRTRVPGDAMEGSPEPSHSQDYRPRDCTVRGTGFSLTEAVVSVCFTVIPYCTSLI